MVDPAERSHSLIDEVSVLDVDGILNLKTGKAKSSAVIVNITSLVFDFFLISSKKTVLKLSDALSLLCVPSFSSIEAHGWHDNRTSFFINGLSPSSEDSVIKHSKKYTVPLTPLCY